MSKVWSVSGNQHYMSDITSSIGTLGNFVYTLGYNVQNGQFYLAKLQNSFDFPYKIYGKDEVFIQRVVKTYKNTSGNLGLLLNGIKGTGKTVTAELISNELNLPVILITHDMEGMCNFLSEIPQDVIIFFDEYEKIFVKDNVNGGKNDVLSIMDGVLSTQFRKVFLLTTNNANVSENMMQRPSRIRYIKTYGDLTLEVINEIVDDKLIDTEFRDKVIEFISEMEIITIDIVKAVIEEVNIHKEDPYNFKDIFNVKSLDKLKTIYKAVIDPATGQAIDLLVADKVRLNILRFNEEAIGDRLHYKKHSNGGWNLLGEIIEIIDDKTLLLREYIMVTKIDEDGEPYQQGDWGKEPITIKLEDSTAYNTVFKNLKAAL